MNKKFIKWLTASVVLLLVIAAATLRMNSSSPDIVTEEFSTDVPAKDSSDEDFFENEQDVNMESNDKDVNPEDSSDESTEATAPESEPEKPEILLEAIEITSFDSYTGPFVEDGSDDTVENILAITVKNNTPQTLQYAEATLLFGDTTAQFAFSTLRPGESVMVLEKNRLEYVEGMEPSSYQFDNVIYFTEEPTLCADKISISALDGAFNVRNISGENLTGNIAIYYKNKTAQGYLGGITYRTVIQGGMAKDEIKQIMVNHFQVDESQIMFADYTEME